MPELPEVEAARQTAEEYIVNKTIVEASAVQDESEFSFFFWLDRSKGNDVGDDNDDHNATTTSTSTSTSPLLPFFLIPFPRNLRRCLSRVLALLARRQDGHRGSQARQKPLAGAGTRRRWRWRWQQRRRTKGEGAPGLDVLFGSLFLFVLGRSHAPLWHDWLLPRQGSQARDLRERRRKCQERQERRRGRRSGGAGRRRSGKSLFSSSVAPALRQARAFAVPRRRPGRLLRSAQVRARAGGAARVGGGAENPGGAGRPQRPAVAARPRRRARQGQQGQGGTGPEDGSHGAVVPGRRWELGCRRGERRGGGGG